MSAELRKVNRRWVVSHSERVQMNYRTLDAVIDDLYNARTAFVPGTASCTLEPSQYNYNTIHHHLAIRGDRYATQEEVRQHNGRKREEDLKALRAKRDRINAALDVLRKEAPAILNRNDVTADDVMEEASV